MDPRLEHRRRRVAEDRARSNLGRLIRLLLVVAVLAALVWLGQSPFLSVGEIEVTGSDRVDVEAALAAHEIVAGRPMLLLDVDAAAAALADDPWVAEVEIARDWPTTVVVHLIERVPAASVLLEEGWWLAAADATLLAEAAGEPPDMGVARFQHLTVTEAADSLEVAGAVEFLAALPVDRQRGASVAAGTDGLEAVLDGFVVRLGRPFDMAAKASVAVALIDEGLEEGSVITVVAPASPAVLAPGGDDADPPDTTTVP